MPVITEDLLGRYHPDTVDVTIFNSKVVGTTFRKSENGEKLDLSFIEDGDFVLVEAEIGNPYDDKACRVIHDESGEHLGYLPAATAKDVWENAMNAGCLYLGRVKVTGKDKGNLGLNLEIRCLKPKSGNQ